jgi:hypothetical protein
MKNTNESVKKRHSLWSSLSLMGLVIVAGLAIAGVTHSYVVTDWLKLQNYVPPSAIVQLADQTTMSAKARHLLYINHPAVEEKAVFNTSCAKFGEQTIVLGCYQGVQRGIHVLAVSDERLQGIEQVTIAHEMLHAAYDRLGSQEKARVDALLQGYADNQLHDQRIVAVLNNYRKTEPGQQLNEMHSIFGTEIANLPAPLEQYYSQYFTNRKSIAAYAAQYQAAFTSRQTTIQQYDSQLKDLGAVIKNNIADLTKEQSAIERKASELDTYRSQDNIQQYNSGVEPYNASIDAYNALLTTTKQQIEDYNQIVAKRNVIATQTQELQKAIDSSSLPSSK